MHMPLRLFTCPLVVLTDLEHTVCLLCICVTPLLLCYLPLQYQAGVLSLPSYLVDLRRKLQRLQDRHQAQHGRQPGISELAAAVGVTVQQAERALQASSLQVRSCQAAHLSLAACYNSLISAAWHCDSQRCVCCVHCSLLLDGLAVHLPQPPWIVCASSHAAGSRQHAAELLQRKQKQATF